MSQPVPLDLVFPRPVLVQLAGEFHKAGELSLGDLATLQSWLRQASPDPLADVPPIWLETEVESRRGRLLVAWKAQKAWPPALGSSADRPYLDSDEGRAVFLVLCLGKWDEEFKAEHASSLASRMDAADWDRLRRVAWGIPPWRSLAAELDPAWLEAQLRDPSDGADWGEVVASVVKTTGIDFATIAGWTPTQLRLVCSEGKLGGYRAVMRPGESREEFARRMIATFRADPDPAA